MAKVEKGGKVEMILDRIKKLLNPFSDIIDELVILRARNREQALDTKRKVDHLIATMNGEEDWMRRCEDKKDES